MCVVVLYQPGLVFYFWRLVTVQDGIIFVRFC